MNWHCLNLMQHQLIVVSDSIAPSRSTTKRLRGYGFGVQIRESLPYDLTPFALILLEFASNPSAAPEMVRNVRSRSSMPLLVLSSIQGVTECIVAFELGADDYVRTPIADLELVARITALIRRAELPHSKKADDFRLGDIEVLIGPRIVRVAGVTVHLTPIEFDLLKILVTNLGVLVTRDAISAEVFHRRSARNRALDVHMSGLRNKLGNSPCGSPRIRTIRGRGYIFNTEES